MSRPHSSYISPAFFWSGCFLSDVLTLTHPSLPTCHTPILPICIGILFFSIFFSSRLYAAVHKLHHAHTHELRLLSALQMGAADVVLTHTLPVLGALALVRMSAGVELSLAKTYLLFQAPTPPPHPHPYPP